MTRPGHTLVELLLALPLGALLFALLLATVIAQARLARGVTDRLGRAETERLAFAVLRHELRWLAREDVAAAGPDSLRLRLLRAVAVTCALPGPGIPTRWQGLRQPNPQKDSVLLVGARGEGRAALEGAAASATCGAGSQTLRLGGFEQRGILLVFEPGSYYLRDRALRFRSGLEGRQPLTGEWFDDRGTALVLVPADSLPAGARVRLRDAAPQAWRWALPNRTWPQ